MIYWALQNKEWLQKIFLFTAICISIVCVHYFTLTIKLLSHINPLFSHFLAYAEGTDFYANVSTMDILMRFAFTFIALFFYKNPTISESTKNLKVNFHPINNTFIQNYINRNVTININDNYKKFLNSKKNLIYNEQIYNKNVYNNSSSYFTNKEINDIKNIKLNNYYKSNEPRIQRINTDVPKKKYKDFMLNNKFNNNGNYGSNQIKNVFRNYKRNNYKNDNYQSTLYNYKGQIIKSYNNNTNNYNNDKYYNFLQQLNKENNFDTYKNNIKPYSDKYHNEISKIDEKCINNYNFKNLYNDNKINEPGTLLKKMNKSSSNFYPKKNYNSLFLINENSENMNFDYKKFYNNYGSRNLSHTNKIINITK